MTLEIYFDGGTRGNRACVYRDKIAKIITIHNRQTNNQLEYSALIFALRSIYKYRDSKKALAINVIGDSELVIKQMKGKNEVRSKNLIDLYEQAIEELNSINNVNLIFYWVPRDENLAGIELDKK